MKYIYIYFVAGLFLVAGFASCEKDTFKAVTEFEPSVLSMHVVDPEPIVAGEVGMFPLVASTNGAPFTKFTVDHLTDFAGSLEETKVLVPYDITIDASGNLSRPVSTIVLEYPITASTKGGDLLTAKFNFTDGNGNVASTTANKLVVNFRTNNTKQYFYSSRPWYNFETGISYSKTSIFTADEDIRNNLEIFWVLKTGQLNFMCSPDSDEAAAAFATDARYDRDEMHHTRFIKIENVQFADVGDDVLKALDFTNSTDAIPLENNGMYGVLLHDGRKAVVFATQYSATIYQLTSVYQVTAE